MKNVGKTGLGIGAVIFCCAACLHAQSPATGPKPVRTPYYVDTTLLNAGVLLPTPPTVGSAQSNAELSELHHLQDTRAAQIAAAAEADDKEEDMFIFRSVIGPDFTPEALPLTAALGQHVKNEQGVIGNQLKRSFQRERPYQLDGTIHPVCEVKATHDSYPSGHALTGYLEALTLVELFPDKRDAILNRADDYAHNRLVCGVHYPSDLEASRNIAYTVFGFMLATPKFQHDLEASRLELQKKNLMGAR